MDSAGCTHAQPTFPALVDGLGEHWELRRNAYKPFPSGIVTHGATTVALELAQLAAPDPEAIERVDLKVHPLCLKLTGRRAPKTTVEATFSVFHWVAVALVDRRIEIAQFSDACVARPEVIRLRDRTNAIALDALNRDAASIRVTMRDGRVLERQVDHALGSFERPLDDAALTAKLRDLATGALGDSGAERLADRAWGIAGLASAAVLADVACGRPERQS